MNHIQELQVMDERIQRKVEKLEQQCQKEAKEFAKKVQELQKSNQVKSKACGWLVPSFADLEASCALISVSWYSMLLFEVKIENMMGSNFPCQRLLYLHVPVMSVSCSSH